MAYAGVARSGFRWNLLGFSNPFYKPRNLVRILHVADRNRFWGGWHERLSALRNVPPVLKIVWRSGPGVVSFGFAARIVAALLPLALAWIPKLIIDILVHLRSAESGPVPQRLWWLVGAEFGLAVLSSIVSRMIDYSD